MSLSAFLAQNALRRDNERYVVSDRFVGEDGKPLSWEIQAINSSKDETLRKECTRKVPVPGKRNQFSMETDYDLYVGKLAAACTAEPNLNDETLQNSYGVMGADALLKAMLTPGEYARYLEKIQEVNGFDASIQEQVDEAKN